jgi:hypothetical protein
MSSGGTGHMLAGDADDVIRCRDRELANLRSLLRSQTRKLEQVAEWLDAPIVQASAELMRAKALVDSVLEALS